MQLNLFLYASLLVCAKKGNKTSYTVKIQYSPEHDLEFSNHLLWSIPFSNRCQHFIKLLKDLLPFLKIRFSSKTYTLSNLS